MNSFTKITTNLDNADLKVIMLDLKNNYRGCSITMRTLQKVLTS